jgi:hypothetical protein
MLKTDLFGESKMEMLKEHHTRSLIVKTVTAKLGVANTDNADFAPKYVVPSVLNGCLVATDEHAVDDMKVDSSKRIDDTKRDSAFTISKTFSDTALNTQQKTTLIDVSVTKDTNSNPLAKTFYADTIAAIAAAAQTANMTFNVKFREDGGIVMRAVVKGGVAELGVGGGSAASPLDAVMIHAGYVTYVDQTKNELNTQGGMVAREIGATTMIRQRAFAVRAATGLILGDKKTNDEYETGTKNNGTASAPFEKQPRRYGYDYKYHSTSWCGLFVNVWRSKIAARVHYDPM